MGSALKETLEKLRGALLFWQREVYEKILKHLPRNPFLMEGKERAKEMAKANIL